MTRGKRSKKSQHEMLDLIKPTDPLKGSEFEVTSYDYLALQQEDAFEADLLCLLGKSNPGQVTVKPSIQTVEKQKQDKISTDKDHNSPLKQTLNGFNGSNSQKPQKLIKINTKKITQDIEEIDLSSDEYASDITLESPTSNIRKNMGTLNKKSSTKVKSKPSTHPEAEIITADHKLTPSTPKRRSKKKAGSVEPDSPSKLPIDTPTSAMKKKRRRPKKKLSTDAELSNVEIKQVANGVEYIDDGKPVKTTGDQVFLQGEKDDEVITVQELKQKKIVAQNYNVVDGEANLSRSQRRRKNIREKKEKLKSEQEQQKTQLESLPEKEDNIFHDPSSPSSVATPRKLCMDDVPRLSASPHLTSPELESPFSVKLRPTSRPMTNAKYSSKLQPIDSIKTIIGISHSQILKMSLTDVKCKTITTSTHISKLMKSALEFAFDNTEGLFKDESLKGKFVQLCVHIALFESPGFKKVNNEFSVNELFGGYEQLSLQKTGTKLTPPMEAIHQNNFDYTLLSYIGNIIIWVYSLQYQEGINDDLAHIYPDLGLEKSAIIKAFGGNHLWDQLNRNAGAVNNKRWKHIVKYREIFGFFEDQFMLLMRFMNIPCKL